MNPVAGFWQSQEVDSAKFVKLFVNGVKAFRELTNAGARVFEALYMEMQTNIGRDRVYLLRPRYAKASKYRSQHSPEAFGNSSRSDSAPTTQVSWYWLNPDFVWNGDRIAFVKEYRRAGTASTIPGPQQEQLPFEDDRDD